MRTLTLTLAAVCCGALAAPRLEADDPVPPPAPAPATAPKAGPDAQGLEAQILSWVAELASDDFRTREAASKHLGEAGEAARAALEAAAKTSDSLEVRWRAQQLLLRIEGPGERPLGAPGDAPPGAPQTDTPLPGSGGQRLRELWGAETPDAMREALERMLREFDRSLRDGGLRGFSPRGLDPFAGFGGMLSAGDLTLTPPLFGQGAWRLSVKEKGENGRGKAYLGASLDEIVAAHPELKDVPGLEDLKKQVAERTQRGDALRHGFSLGSAPDGTVTMRSSQGVEMTQDANGATLRITTTGADGKPEVHEYQGATLEEIKQQHPELARQIESLGTFEIHVSPPRLFRGDRRLDGLAPRPPADAPEPPRPAPQLTPEDATFGVLLAPVEPVLALHLGLAEGRGLLIERVEPGSQAEALGLERYDVLETVGGVEVESLAPVVRALRTAAKDRSPIALGIIRTGKRQTLAR